MRAQVSKLACRPGRWSGPALPGRSCTAHSPRAPALVAAQRGGRPGPGWISRGEPQLQPRVARHQTHWPSVSCLPAALGGRWSLPGGARAEGLKVWSGAGWGTPLVRLEGRGCTPCTACHAQDCILRALAMHKEQRVTTFACVMVEAGCYLRGAVGDTACAKCAAGAGSGTSAGVLAAPTPGIAGGG